MGECGILVSLLTLDNFYNKKTIKGKINLLIFLTFKVMAPVWTSVSIGDDTIATYKADMAAHYKNHMKTICHDAEESRLPDDEIRLESLENNKASDRATELWKKLEENTNSTQLTTDTCLLTDREDVNMTEIITEMIQVYNDLLDNLRESADIEEDILKLLKLDYCCKNFKNMADETVTCLRQKKAAIGEDLIPFQMTLYLPCFFCILMALIMAPLKRIPVTKKLLFESDDTCDSNEKMDYFNNYLNFFADLLAFYALTYKLRRIGLVMDGKCAKNFQCLPDYLPPQILHLILMSQVPWISIISNFIY